MSQTKTTFRGSKPVWGTVILVHASLLAACGGMLNGKLVISPSTTAQSGDSVPNNSSNSVPVEQTPVPEELRVSKGSGGALGLVDDTYTSQNGEAGKFRLQVPQNNSLTHAHGLIVYLHGDGGADYDWFFDDIQGVAAANNLIAMAARSPNDGAAWYKNGEKQAEYLNELIQKQVFPKYNVQLNQIVFVGASGGSQFLTGQFVPKYGVNYEGGSLQMCGGPRNWLPTFESKPEFLKRFSLAFYTPQGDLLFPQVEQGIAYFEAKGFQVWKERPEGTGHCAFKMVDVVKKYVPQILAAHP